MGSVGLGLRSAVSNGVGDAGMEAWTVIWRAYSTPIGVLTC